MTNNVQLQGIISITALFCIIVGWFNLFTPQINYILSEVVFYILLAVSFVLQAPSMTTSLYKNLMYAFAVAMVLGAVLPKDMGLNFLKMIGLLGGIMLTLIGRPRIVRK